MIGCAKLRDDDDTAKCRSRTEASTRRLPPDAATELSALAERLAELAPNHRIDWSDSWSEITGMHPLPRTPATTDHVLQDWQSAGLRAESCFRAYVLTAHGGARGPAAPSGLYRPALGGVSPNRNDLECRRRRSRYGLIWQQDTGYRSDQGHNLHWNLVELIAVPREPPFPKEPTRRHSGIRRGCDRVSSTPRRRDPFPNPGSRRRGRCRERLVPDGSL